MRLLGSTSHSMHFEGLGSHLPTRPVTAKQKEKREGEGVIKDSHHNDSYSIFQFFPYHLLFQDIKVFWKKNKVLNFISISKTQLFNNRIQGSVMLSDLSLKLCQISGRTKLQKSTVSISICINKKLEKIRVKEIYPFIPYLYNALVNTMDDCLYLTVCMYECILLCDVWCACVYMCVFDRKRDS